MSTFEQQFATEKEIFLDLTHQLNNYNEIYNLNLYLKQNGTEEKNRLYRLNESLKSKMLQAKQEYVMQDYMISYKAFECKVLFFAILITAIVLVLTGLFMRNNLSFPIFIGASVAVIIVYIIGVVIAVKSNADRKKTSWNQYYWAPMKST